MCVRVCVIYRNPCWFTDTFQTNSQATLINKQKKKNTTNVYFKSRMLSGRWSKPNWLKHVAAQVGYAHLSGLNVTLYSQFKRSFSFSYFHPISNFPLQSFFEPIRPKRDYKIVYESSKGSRLRDLEREHRPRQLQHSTSHKFVLTFLLRPLMEPAWPENHHPIYHSLFQRRRFSFPVDTNFGWPRKSVIHPDQHKYWNILFLDFHYHSTHIKCPKINSFLSIQLRTFSQTFLAVSSWCNG